METGKGEAAVDVSLTSEEELLKRDVKSALEEHLAPEQLVRYELN